jgi:hypothetical protein
MSEISESGDNSADRPDLKRLDTGTAHIARVYDYWLGGKDNFAADRAAGEEALEAFPGLISSVRANRASARTARPTTSTRTCAIPAGSSRSRAGRSTSPSQFP